MKFSYHKVQQLLRQSERSHLTQDGLRLAQSRSWQAIQARMETVTPAFNVWRLTLAPVVLTLVVILCVVSAEYVSLRNQNGLRSQLSELQKQLSEREYLSKQDQEKIIEDLGLDPSTVYIPEDTQASPSPTGSSVPSLRGKITLKQGVYQYGAAGAVNLANGIRIPKNVAKGRLLSQAYAADPYPAVFTILHTGVDSWGLFEINMYSGETRQLAEGTTKNYIMHVHFNEQNQVLAYTRYEYNGKNDPDTDNNYDANVVIHNLNSGEKKTIFTGHGISERPKWSPDGKYLAFYNNLYEPIPHAAIPSGQTFYFYSMEKQELLTYNLPTWETPGRPGYQFHFLNEFFWNAESTEILSSVRANQPYSMDEYPSQVLVTLQRATGEITVSNDLMSSDDNAQEPAKIGDTIIGRTFPRNITAFQDKSPLYNSSLSWRLPSKYGWFTVYNTKTKTYQEYKSVAGEYSAQWITDHDAKKIVYTDVVQDAKKVSVLKVGVLNVEKNTNQDFIFPYEVAKDSKLIGWNGNEENIIVLSGMSTFFNINITTGEITRITF